MVAQAELRKALLAEAPKQWTRFQARREKMERGKPKWQRETDEMDKRVADVKANVEELSRKYDSELMRINNLFERKIGLPSGALRCPKCQDVNHGNTMNGKPWCLKCNVALESPFLVKKRLPDVKILPKIKKLDVTFRRLDE